jgi:hypothetical protein
MVAVVVVVVVVVVVGRVGVGVGGCVCAEAFWANKTTHTREAASLAKSALLRFGCFIEFITRDVLGWSGANVVLLW